jgi:hypothetical protein
MPQRAESGSISCQFCNKDYKARGIHAHERRCSSRPTRSTHAEPGIPDGAHQDPQHGLRQEGERAHGCICFRCLISNLSNLELDALLLAAGVDAHISGQASQSEDNTQVTQGIYKVIIFWISTDKHIAGPGNPFDDGEEASLHAATQHEQEVDVPIQMDPDDDEVEIDDIKVVHHPHSGITQRIFRFDDYCGAESFKTDEIKGCGLSGDDLERPWRPFRTRLDFEIAEVMLDAHMNTPQTERMISLIHEAILHPDSFTLANAGDLSAVWDVARETRTDKVVSFSVNAVNLLIDNTSSSRKLFPSNTRTRASNTMSFSGHSGLGVKNFSWMLPWWRSFHGMRNTCSDGMETGSNDSLMSPGQQIVGGIFR